MKGHFIVNGRETSVRFSPDAVLLDVLRQCGHTEVKEGCKTGECGACTVLLDGEPVNSCRVMAAAVIGRNITTVKGIGTIHEPHPLQRAFADAGAVQCGFCTPGMLLASYALLREKPDPTDEEIRTALDGNLCRCTGYVKIIQAVKLAAERMRHHE